MPAAGCRRAIAVEGGIFPAPRRFAEQGLASIGLTIQPPRKDTSLARLAVGRTDCRTGPILSNLPRGFPVRKRSLSAMSSRGQDEHSFPVARVTSNRKGGKNLENFWRFFHFLSSFRQKSRRCALRLGRQRGARKLRCGDIQPPIFPSRCKVSYRSGPIACASGWCEVLWPARARPLSQTLRPTELPRRST